jgi:hypothetical protein
VSNMSYCRFQNTLQDLRDCYEAIHDADYLSEDEKKARLRLIEICKRIADECEDE